MTEHDAVRDQCERRLSHHRARSVRETLAEIGRSPLAALPPDSYGTGEAIGALERGVAALLGKPAAVFMAKGVTAQQAALRAWSDRSGRRAVALHPKSHIALDERDAFARLHPLSGVRIGADHLPFDVAALDAVAEPLAAVLVELPLRRAGYKSPDWEALAAIAAWCRAGGVPLHLDGARLWEAQPFYARPLSEITALADSVYVSFYKGLGGLGGAILAGPDAFIAEARVWHARHCGALMTAFPFVISAADGMARHLPRMGDYFRRARGLAEALGGVPGVRVTPDPPRCNAFQVFFDADAPALDAAHLAFAREHRTWLFGHVAQTAVPGWSVAEVVIGDAAEDFSDAEVANALGRLLVLARG